MRHKILNVSDSHPYEILKVEIIGDNKSEEESIKSVDEVMENYLILTLNAVEVIDNSTPFFLIKRTKEKLGFG
jgi:hypothetical protein